MLSITTKSNMMEQIISDICEQCPPEDIYDTDILEQWAKDNDFVKKDEVGE